MYQLAEDTTAGVIIWPLDKLFKIATSERLFQSNQEWAPLWPFEDVRVLQGPLQYLQKDFVDQRLLWKNNTVVMVVWGGELVPRCYVMMTLTLAGDLTMHGRDCETRWLGERPSFVGVRRPVLGKSHLSILVAFGVDTEMADISVLRWWQIA